MLSTSGDEVIQVASPSKNFFTLALPAARQLDRGERKSACVGALFWIIRACAIVVGLCRGVKTFLVAKRFYSEREEKSTFFMCIFRQQHRHTEAPGSDP